MKTNVQQWQDRLKRKEKCLPPRGRKSVSVTDSTETQNPVRYTSIFKVNDGLYSLNSTTRENPKRDLQDR